MHEYPLKDYLNSINLKQGDLSKDERAMQKYPAFVVNKCLSAFIDTVMHANEMNASSHLDKDLQYQYYICLLYTSPSPRDRTRSRMPSSA